MSDQTPTILAPNGQPIRRRPRPDDGRCPRCGAGQEKRIDAAGFGPDRKVCCGECGQRIAGATEC